MASHDPSKYEFSTPTYVLLFGTLLTAYYMYVASSPVSLARTKSNLLVIRQLGYLNVAKESFQNANPRCLRVPQDLPPTSRWYHPEPQIYPDRPWKQVISRRMVGMVSQARRFLLK